MIRALALAAAAMLAGCGNEALEAEPKVTQPLPQADVAGQAVQPGLAPPRCPAAANNCAAAIGSVLAVEAVDPDGDGDAHLVLLSAQAITAPGITVIDVGRELRPDPLPQPGDRVAAAGPVYRGSYGQRQIQATALRVRRR